MISLPNLYWFVEFLNHQRCDSNWDPTAWLGAFLAQLRGTRLRGGCPGTGHFYIRESLTEMKARKLRVIHYVIINCWLSSLLSLWSWWWWSSSSWSWSSSSGGSYLLLEFQCHSLYCTIIDCCHSKVVCSVRVKFFPWIKRNDMLDSMFLVCFEWWFSQHQRADIVLKPHHHVFLWASFRVQLWKKPISSRQRFGEGIYVAIFCLIYCRHL